MMDQASLMVGQIVETTNEAFSIPEPKMERGASFFVMPPPKPRKQPAAAGLDLLSETAVAGATIKDSVVITPDLTSRKSELNLIPSLQLPPAHQGEVHGDEDPDTHMDDVSVDELSVDQCASIIDDVFGCMDNTILQGPPLKKAKTSE